MKNNVDIDKDYKEEELKELLPDLKKKNEVAVNTTGNRDLVNIDMAKYDVKQLRQDITLFNEDSYTARLFVFLFNELERLDEEITYYTGEAGAVKLLEAKYKYLGTLAANWIKYNQNVEAAFDPNSPIVKLITNFFLKKFVDTIKLTVSDSALREHILISLNDNVRNTYSDLQNEVKNYFASKNKQN